MLKAGFYTSNTINSNMGARINPACEGEAPLLLLPLTGAHCLLRGCIEKSQCKQFTCPLL